jgi:hypothetical protein
MIELFNIIFVESPTGLSIILALGTGGSKLWDKVRANLNWFRKNNAKAYMVLLD